MKKEFKNGLWNDEINVADFINHNIQHYDFDESFLEGPTDSTIHLLNKLNKLDKKELKKGVLDMDTKIVSSMTSHKAGYLNKKYEKIVGLQTDKPLKRAFMPYGGIRMAEEACQNYGYKVDKKIDKVFTDYRKTHNQAVFDAYTPEMKLVRKAHLLTGLPDTYGRGRIVGDYRRIALYGVNRLIEQKKKDLNASNNFSMDDEEIRTREEISEQIKALEELKKMALIYGYDISNPAMNAKEAIQWLYFGYLGAIKTQNGAAMSIGRISSFIDIYIERDIENGDLTEDEAQELIDQLVLKLRMVRFARITSYNELFSGDPIWATLEIGGMDTFGNSMVTKTDYRFLHTLENMGPSPEPNITVLYSKDLPLNFKRYAAKISVKTSSIQYENDDLMRKYWGDDYSVCCCVSATTTGKQMQFFGARANLAKCLLYAINGGKDENILKGKQVGPVKPVLAEDGKKLNYDSVVAQYKYYLEWLANIYVNTLNLIHYMHDKYYYESEEMALIDTNVKRTFATGIAGFSHVVDSLSAIKYAKVYPLVKDGIAVDFKTVGEFPRYGNDDDRADSIAVELLKYFMECIKKVRTYRNSTPSTSILTITSNVVYGKVTGSMPDGRKAGEPFSPGANPAYGAEKNGLLASLNSVAKLPYEYAMDGISNTQTISPSALGHDDKERSEKLVDILDGYFWQGAHHLNVNVFGIEKLKDAMEHPEKEEYQNFTVRVSGYAVKFIKLTKEQQLDIIARNSHGVL